MSRFSDEERARIPLEAYAAIERVDDMLAQTEPVAPNAESGPSKPVESRNARHLRQIAEREAERKAARAKPRRLTDSEASALRGELLSLLGQQHDQLQRQFLQFAETLTDIVDRCANRFDELHQELKRIRIEESKQQALDLKLPLRSNALH